MTKEKPRVIVVAGPQSSGKSTALAWLEEKPSVVILPEVNPASLTGHQLGGLASNEAVEQAIVDEDLRQVTNQLEQLEAGGGERVLVWETGPFHLVYGHHYRLPNVDQLSQRYRDLLDRTQPGLIFIETKPEVSWRRRQDNYQRRVAQFLAQEGPMDSKEKQEKARQLLDQYRQRLEALYPFWQRQLREWPHPQVVIANNDLSFDQFRAEVEQAFEKLLLSWGRHRVIQEEGNDNEH